MVLCFIVKTRSTGQDSAYSYASQIARKCGGQFVKLGYLPSPKRACSTLYINGNFLFLILNNNSSTSLLCLCPVLMSYSIKSFLKLPSSVSKLSLYSNNLICLKTNSISVPSQPKLKEPTDSSTERIKSSRSALATLTSFKFVPPFSVISSKHAIYI